MRKRKYYLWVLNHRLWCLMEYLKHVMQPGHRKYGLRSWLEERPRECVTMWILHVLWLMCFVTVLPQETHWPSPLLSSFCPKICLIVSIFNRPQIKTTKTNFQNYKVVKAISLQCEASFINYIQRFFFASISKKIILIVKLLHKFNRNIGNQGSLTRFKDTNS